MLTGKLLRVRYHRNRLIPIYIHVDERDWRDVAAHLLEVFRTLTGKTRFEAEEELRETVGDHPGQVVQQGLAKLLEDRCDFEVDSEHEPDELRERVFIAAARSLRERATFDRNAILERVAGEMGTTVEVVDRGLFADLKSEQRIVKFEDCTVDQLLHRYNVALVQSVLLRATSITVHIHGETASRYRQLFRAIKFHKLICEIQTTGPETYTLRLDGPLSLFSSTQKYGMQLANFLPHILQCKRFELKAMLRWGAQRKEKTFELDHSQDLRSHLVDRGDYVPSELRMFAESFRKSARGWELSTDADVVSLPSGVWIPDFNLVHRASGQVVRVEILGFWRRTDAERLYRRLASELGGPFILAVSEQFNIDETLDESWGKNVYRFKRTPLPSEIVKLAEAQV